MDQESQRFYTSLQGGISPPLDSDVRVLGINSFFDTNINLHRAYLDTNGGMNTVAFVGVGIPLMADIPVYGIMEKLQSSYPERRGELVEIMGIDLNFIIRHFSDGQRIQTCADYDWSHTTIQGDFIK